MGNNQETKVKKLQATQSQFIKEPLIRIHPMKVYTGRAQFTLEFCNEKKKK